MGTFSLQMGRDGTTRRKVSVYSALRSVGQWLFDRIRLLQLIHDMFDAPETRTQAYRRLWDKHGKGQ